MIILAPPIIADDDESAHALLERVMRKQSIAYDTETTGVSRWRDRVVCFSLAFRDSEYGDSTHGVARAVISAKYLPLFAPMFGNERITKIMHNAPFDMCLSWSSGVEDFLGFIVDTLVLDQNLDENRQKAHDLKTMAWDYLGLRMRRFPDVFKEATAELERALPTHEFEYVCTSSKGVERTKHFSLRGAFGDYASVDAWATYVLAVDELIPRTKDEVLDVAPAGKKLTQWDVYRTLFAPLIRVVANMCRRGWLVDRDYFLDMIPVCEASLRKIDNLFNRYAALAAMVRGRPLHLEMSDRDKNMFPGGAINPGSDQQLRRLLFDILGYPVLQMTDGGTSGVKQPSVNDEVLDALYKEHGCTFASLVQERRSISKTMSTYLRGISEAADNGGRVHPSLTIMGARTGRFSCSDPNLRFGGCKSSLIAGTPCIENTTTRVVKPIVTV